MAGKLSTKEIKDLASDLVDSFEGDLGVNQATSNEIKSWLGKYKIEFTDDDVKAIVDELVGTYGLDINESKPVRESISTKLKAIIINESAIEKVSQLKKGESYGYTGGAEYLKVKYIGPADENPDLKPGSSMGKGFLFQWDDGSYVELSFKGIRQNIETLEEETTNEADIQEGEVAFDKSEPEYEVALDVKDQFMVNKIKKVAQELELEGSPSGFVIATKTILKKFVNLLRGLDIKINSILDGHNVEVSLASIPAYGKPGRPTNKYNYPNRMREANEAELEPTHICTLPIKGDSTDELIPEGAKCHIDDKNVVEDLDGGIIMEITPEELEKNFKPVDSANESVDVVNKLFKSIYNLKHSERMKLFDEILKIAAGKTKDRTKMAAECLAKKPSEYKRALKMMLPSVHKFVYEEGQSLKFPMIAECDDSGALKVNALFESIKSGKKLEKIRLKGEFEDDGLPCINAVAYIGGKQHKFSDWHLEQKMVKKYYHAENGDRGALQGIKNRLTRLGNDYIKEHRVLQKELQSIAEAETLANKSMSEKFGEWMKQKKFKLYSHVWKENDFILKGLFIAPNKPKPCLESSDEEVMSYCIGCIPSSEPEEAKYPWEQTDIDEAYKMFGNDEKLNLLFNSTMECYPKELPMEEQMFESQITEAVDEDYFEVESKLKDICFQASQGQIAQEEAVKEIDDILKDSEELSAAFNDIAPEALVDEVINYYGWTESMLAEAVNPIADDADAQLKEIIGAYYQDLLPTADAIKQSREVLDKCGDDDKRELIDECAGLDDESLLSRITAHFGWNVVDLIA